MDVVEEQLLAYNARDLDRFTAVYSPDVVIEDGMNKVLIKGHDQMRERYATLFASSPELHCTIVSRMRIGNYVVDEEEITGSGGSPATRRAVVIYRVEGDKIAHVRILR